MSTPRRKFLSWLGASSALAASASMFKSESLHAQPAQPAQENKWDVSWTDRLKGKYKAVFDCPETGEGAAMFRACIWRDQHKEVYGTPQSETSPVLVVRHAAMALIMDDEYWRRFGIGDAEKMIDPATDNGYAKNPIRVGDPKATGAFARYNLTDFMADGGIVLACNLAFRSVVSKYQRTDKLSPADARKVALEHMVPGVIMQPSGIFAVLRAQEVGCNYVVAS
ncbi:MAG: hypothetical protein H7Z40_10185 [Phycisphaerae bacterium]|nr:hypothetical protein [Gemmatimonadaceae bacterium]